MNENSIMKKGQTYKGRTHQEKTKRGTVKYRQDGSILYSSQTDAYSRAVSNTKLTGREQFVVATSEGTMVTPDYLNTENAQPEEYGYSWEDGDLIDPVDNKTMCTVTHVYTHPRGSRPSGEDLDYAALNNPGTILFVLGVNSNTVFYYGAVPPAPQLEYDAKHGVFPHSDVLGILRGYDLISFAR